MKSKRTAGKRKGGKRRMFRRKRSTNVIGGPNTAKITETYDLGTVNLNTPETYYFDGIPANTRAAEVAPNFGLYRIALVEYTIVPYYDTYAPSTGSGNFPVGVPHLYWKMNRYGDAPAAFTSEFLKDQGAKPIRLDDRSVKIRYRPNILLADAGAAAAGLHGGSGQVKMTPWLSTDNEVDDNNFALSTTQHYGHMQFIEGPGAGSADSVVGTVTAKVIWEFKNPRGVASTPGAPMTVKKTVGATIQHV